VNKIAVVSINQPSLDASKRLLSYLDSYEVRLFSKAGLDFKGDNLQTFSKLDDILPLAWREFDAIIFILATGAVIRKIAPLLKDKTKDPAVVVINLELTRIVPLLSGHLGGANELSFELEKSLPECVNFLTTATDQTKSLAFDMFAKKEGFKIENIKKLAPISNALINKKEVKVWTYKAIFELIKEYPFVKLADSCDEEFCINITPFQRGDNLHLVPKVYLGIGCNRGVSASSIKSAVEQFLKKHELKFSQIENIASFEAKRDEEGLLKFAKDEGFDIKFFDKERINALEGNFTPSQATKFFDLKGVAEPSAVLLSTYKELILKKEVYNKEITIAGAV
jgi:cobalt-precorrin 5A hydrolase